MSLLYYLLSFLSGIALTLQAGINGQLREKVGSPILSSLISFAVGMLSLAIVFANMFSVVLLVSGVYIIEKF
jgi:transporter family-2 protein